MTPPNWKKVGDSKWKHKERDTTVEIEELTANYEVKVNPEMVGHRDGILRYTLEHTADTAMRVMENNPEGRPRGYRNIDHETKSTINTAITKHIKDHWTKRAERVLIDNMFHHSDGNIYVKAKTYEGDWDSLKEVNTWDYVVSPEGEVIEFHKITARDKVT